MGRIFKKPITRPLPDGAEIVTRQGGRVATWRDSRGKLRTAPITVGRDGSLRIRDRSKTYFARYRDGNGDLVEVSTQCRDETAARQVLANLERRAERVRAGLMTATEERIADHLATPITQHVAAYVESMRLRGIVPMHRENVRRQLERILADCHFVRLSDLNRASLERWMGQEADRGRSARSRNAHRAAILAFANWCVSNGRLASNPLLGIAKANEAADPRRRRRAMTEEELSTTPLRRTTYCKTMVYGIARMIDSWQLRPCNPTQIKRGQRVAESDVTHQCKSGRRS